jgi:DNA-binding NarL/FixJ family response regulator
LNGILIVDDHQVMRAGLRSLLVQASLDVCAEAENGKEAVEKFQQLRPSLVILDITMPVMNGIEASRRIREMDPAAKIIIFTMHDSAEMEREAKRAGADALIVKNKAAEELVTTVKRLLQLPELVTPRA